MTPERLKEIRAKHKSGVWHASCSAELDLLAHIDALQEREKRLREALERIASAPSSKLWTQDNYKCAVAMTEDARAALSRDNTGEVE